MPPIALPLLVPYRLRRRITAAPANAVWLATDDMSRLAALIPTLGNAGWPEIFATAGGFLIIPNGRLTACIPASVKLRRLAGNLYHPADADLEPELLQAESVDLTRDRGLIFLPGQAPLVFDPARPLQPSDLVAPIQMTRHDWRAIPPAPRLAERLTSLRFTGPTQPLAVLDLGGPDGGVDDDLSKIRPPSTPNVTKQVTGRAAMGLGKLLSKMGAGIGSKNLANLGAKLAAWAVQQVPRLTEHILGKQEVALRELLRRFKSGDIEGALKQAPPAFSDSNRPAQADTGWKLPSMNPLYSLSQLLRGWSGPAMVWFGGGNVWNDLAAEYRRQAADASQRGDFRRAAYIYGMLLRDLHQAAAALAAGRLHRDAALIYRDRLHSRLLAAKQFALAGDLDEAVQLYVELGEHVEAAELLRQLGHDDEALEHYRAAAEKLVKGTGGWLAAGDLLRDRAGRADLAEACYRSGWANRPHGTADGCAARLLPIHLADVDRTPLWQFLGEAEEYFAPPTLPLVAGRFYADVVRAAGHRQTADIADELRDRARLALAGHICAPSFVLDDATKLFGAHSEWPAAVVRDAFVASRLQSRAMRHDAGVRVDGIFPGPVSAVVVARGTADIIAAGPGWISCWRPSRGVLDTIPVSDHQVHSLATDDEGRFVVALSECGEGSRLLGYGFPQRGVTQTHAEWVVPNPISEVSLLPRIHVQGGRYVAHVMFDRRVHDYTGTNCVMVGHWWPPGGSSSVFMYLRETQQLMWAGRCVYYTSRRDDKTSWHFAELPWMPQPIEGHALQTPACDYRGSFDGGLELAGVTEDGVLRWSTLATVNGELSVDSTATAAAFAHVTAFSFVRPGLLAAVTKGQRVSWLRWNNGRVSGTLSAEPLPVPDPVAAIIARPADHEVAVVFATGAVARLPIPR